MLSTIWPTAWHSLTPPLLRSSAASTRFPLAWRTCRPSCARRPISSKKALTGGSSDAISSAIEGAVELNGYKLVVAELQGLEAADLRNVWDTVHQKVAGPVACVVASVTEKGTPALLAAGSDDAVKAGFHAGNVIKQIVGLVDGRGGGRPNMAQAGGKNAAGIADALAAAKTALGA